MQPKAPGCVVLEYIYGHGVETVTHFNDVASDPWQLQRALEVRLFGLRELCDRTHSDAEQLRRDLASNLAELITWLQAELNRGRATSVDSPLMGARLLADQRFLGVLELHRRFLEIECSESSFRHLLETVAPAWIEHRQDCLQAEGLARE